jgi:hypothetical protein
MGDGLLLQTGIRLSELSRLQVTDLELLAKNDDMVKSVLIKIK